MLFEVGIFFGRFANRRAAEREETEQPDKS